ncbi:uncharacterized protein STEHIDRAFT_117537 [Stereum hirsutum FP-91666 SS1]|uniref:uncharacterized protein n=1 Tax=Stereum hirsutum (strain FP-91666) TaxID=721885 RepID=UPI000440C000|nr:uncharacterized protein STEHIDRAFT_117537 [Stereum hirsutum FP-91666 SS1]EIM92531.1 hypothetical protein STEHIDRAFT_117537 [Stereum hirsutum FP-91666 SS1]
MAPEPTSGGSAPTYEEKPTVRYTAAAALQATMVGAFVSTIQNALGAHNQGAAGFFTRSGGTIGFFAAMGATFAGTRSVVANTRQVDDSLNGVAGGCAAGFLAGIRSRSLPMAVGSCAVLAALVGTFEYTGESLQGDTSSLSFEERRRRFFKHEPPQAAGPAAPTAAVTSA